MRKRIPVSLLMIEGLSINTVLNCKDDLWDSHWERELVPSAYC